VSRTRITPSACDSLTLAFDFHNSQAEAGRANPWGTNSVLGTAGFYRGTTTVDWSEDLPALGLDFLAGTTALDPSQHLITGSSFRNGLADAEVMQARFDGSFEFTEDYSLDFGIMATEVDNRTAYSNVQNNTWGGAGTPADFDDSNFFIDSQSPASYFDNVSGSGNPIWTPELMRVNLPGIVADAEAAGLGTFGASDDFTIDQRTSEDTISAYVPALRGYRGHLERTGAGCHRCDVGGSQRVQRQSFRRKRFRDARGQVRLPAAKPRLQCRGDRRPDREGQLQRDDRSSRLG
jgi:hypothetical protein